MCLTTESDLLGGGGGRGFGWQGLWAGLAPPLLVSAEFKEATGSRECVRRVGVGEQWYQMALIPTWGGGGAGHLGLGLAIWLKTAVSCSTPRTNL